MFASKTPRDLNHDPMPHINGHGNRQDHPFVGQCCTTRYEPRAFYDHAQHNEPNPILVAYRRGHVNADQVRHRGSALVGAWVDAAQITPEHADHARRVLTRVSSLWEVS